MLGLARRRHELGLTQREVVERVNDLLPDGQSMSMGRYADYERGARPLANMTVRYATVLARVLRVTDIRVFATLGDPVEEQ